MSKTVQHGHGGGTRPLEDQREVETIAMSLIWDNADATEKWLVNTFGISKSLGEKLFRLKAEGKMHEDRKTRSDSIVALVEPFVYAFCHDDFVTRADTSGGASGGTARSFVKVRESDGEVKSHVRRTWPCSTYAEKFELFKKTLYYLELKQALSGKRTGIDRKSSRQREI